MIDQLIIGNVASYDDFEASVKERKIEAPKKKSIKETVPFSNVTYDFSAINGELYWEERTLEYTFEITALNPEALEEKKLAFVAWVMNTMNAKIYDPFIRDFHFVGTFDSISFDESEFEKSTITVRFTAYPYKIANKERIYTVTLPANESITVKIANDSSHRITPTFVSDVACTVALGDSSYSVPSGETKDDAFKLMAGTNVLTFKASTSGTIKIEFLEEVF